MSDYVQRISKTIVGGKESFAGKRKFIPMSHLQNIRDIFGS
jgi:hypothetical protein